jgi:SAM-dependent methyltransferase
MSTADFYDAIEPFYHLIFADWQASIDRQGEALSKVIHARSASAQSVLDATCGIGTQTLGLAGRGFRMTASDVSPASVRRLRVEAAARQLEVDASTSDVRQLWEHHRRTFDVVMSCDNSLPHLQPSDVPLALRQMFLCTRVGGCCLITVRDYANENLTGQQLRPYGVRQLNDRQVIAFQTWDCHEDRYDFTLYFVEDNGRDPPTCHCARSTYYPISTDRLIGMMTDAGFVKVERLDGVFFQPVLLGERLDAVLSGKSVPHARTTVLGCEIPPPVVKTEEK